MRWFERARLAAEPKHLAALVEIAGRAYRRPLSQAESDDLIAFYRRLRADDHLDHEDAVRDTLVSILMSPYFCYRVNATEPGEGVFVRNPAPCQAIPKMRGYFTPAKSSLCRIRLSGSRNA